MKNCNQYILDTKTFKDMIMKFHKNIQSVIVFLLVKTGVDMAISRERFQMLLKEMQEKNFECTYDQWPQGDKEVRKVSMMNIVRMDDPYEKLFNVIN